MFRRSTCVLACLVALSFPLSSFAAQIQVVVGGPGVLQFSPSSVTAAPGDEVIFTFKQRNHTATQSTFENPCEMSPGGFDTGFIPVAENNINGPFPAAQFTVTDTNPVWVYCRQGNHCQQGMVFAINPGDRFAAFQAAAMGHTATSTGGPASASSTPPPASTSALPSYTAAPTLISTSTTVHISSSSAAPASTSSTSASIPTSTSRDHKVTVGGPSGQLTFSPANITAQVGDTVTFEFHQKNHTVTQSTFAEPCISLTQTSTSGQVGFDSGFRPVANGATTFPTFTIQINDTAPIWAFCKQGNHCGQGMVFAINAIENGPNNFAAFQERARQLNGTSSNTTSTSGASSLRITSGFGGALLSALAGVYLL